MMILRLLSIIGLLTFSKVHSEDIMNESMYNLQKTLKEKCSKGEAVPFSKDFFPQIIDFTVFTKQLEALLISKPSNACDFLKHPQIFSAISVLPQMQYDKEAKSVNYDYLKKLEIEYSRKFYISKLLGLKEKFLSAEKESIVKKQALNSTDFYLKGLVACIDSNCPESIYQIIKDKIPKKNSQLVYDENIKKIFLDENNLEAYFRVSYSFEDGVDLTYNGSKAMKNSIFRLPSKQLQKTLQYIESYHPNTFAVINVKEWVKYLYSMKEMKESFIEINELKFDKFISKNVIGFAEPSSRLWEMAYDSSSQRKDFFDTINLLKKVYNAELVVYEKPDWNSRVIHPKFDSPFKKKEIDYEIDYYNIYGVVNSESGNWFLLKDENNKEFWIHQSQFNSGKSISSILLDSNLADDVSFYESPDGTKTKKTSSNLIYHGFNAKAFRWIKDQLWILVDTKNFEPCDGGEEANQGGTNVPVKDLWIKAFRDDGKYNFLHASRGC